jgi:hypothetical protein
VQSGYRFTYRPVAPGADGKIEKYEIDARPVEFGKTGTRNFRLVSKDGSRVRFTTEDRAATASDPVKMPY